MANALRQYDPGVAFYAFLADRPDGYFQPEREPFRIIPLKAYLAPDLLAKMSGYYTAFEFCNALKPFAHRYMADRTNTQAWCYLDSDIFVCASMNPCFDELSDCSILLTSHILKPCALAISEARELTILQYATYNGGFVGMTRSPDASHFLDWWGERLIRLGLDGDPSAPYLNGDQKWLDFVPALFPGAKILRAQEVNVAYWNLHERCPELCPDGKVYVAGKGIPFFHFSGWDWREPRKLSRHHPLGQDAPFASAWGPLSDAFHRRLKENSVETTSGWPYSFDRADNGETLTVPMRRKFLAYCNAGGDIGDRTIFSHPEAFRRETGHPNHVPLKSASRIFAGSMLRALGWHRSS